jgi:hypothetical protein
MVAKYEKIKASEELNLPEGLDDNFGPQPQILDNLIINL